MRISLLIATYGEPGWAERGRTTLDDSLSLGADEAFAYHVSEGTLARARNEAAAAAIGDWLCFLDADDRLETGYLFAMRMRFAEVARESGADLSLFAQPYLLTPTIRYVHPNGREERPRFPNRHRPMQEMNHCVIGTLVPRDLFLSVGGFPELPIYEDWALFLACVRAGARLVDVPAAVYRASVRPDGRNVGPAAEETYWEIRKAHEAGVR